MEKTSSPSPRLSALGSKLQTTVPSAIRKRNEDSGSGSVASTLKGSQNRKLSTLVPEALPNGWETIKHPDWGVYYVHEEKGVATLSNILNPKIHSLVIEGADVLQASPSLHVLLDDHEVGLVLDVQHGNKGVETSYYCVSHVERRVFWLEGIGHEEVDIPCTSIKCVKSNDKGSRVHCIEAQYWKHCELFPTTLAVTKDLTGGLKDILLQAAADRLLVKFSTSPYGKDDLAYMLNLVKEIEADVQEGSGRAAWVIAKFMALYNDGLLSSSYGQIDDYFDIDDTKPIGPYQRSFFLAILGPVLFKSPDIYAVELHSLHDSFTLERWSRFVNKVDQSIRDSNLLATVLLGANMGFLAWEGSGAENGLFAPAAKRILSYISIICSIGSIIIGLAIFKQYRAKGADTPLRAVVVLKRILKESFGLDRLAIICSLPQVLLLWSLVAFLAGFAIVFYDNTDIQVRIPVTIALFLVFLCLFFCMYTAGPPEKEEEGRKKRFLKSKAKVESASKV